MRIAVTGALGHIGSQLIRDLPSLIPDVELVLIDNLCTQRYCSLFNLPNTARYRFLEADVLKVELERLLKGTDVVIHLAAITDATSSFDNPEHVERVNLEGTERVAHACVELGAKLVFPSTTSVYGTQQTEVREDLPVEALRPQSPYAESKLKAELLLNGLGTSHRLRFVTLRFGTIFGTSPGMRFHTAVNKFIWQACSGTPITVWRDAIDQYRPYLDVHDAIRALGFVVASDLFHQETYNVLTLNATVREILSAIERYVHDIHIQYVDTRIMNQLSYRVCRRKFEQLGFCFAGELQSRIRESIALLSNIRGISNAPFTSLEETTAFQVCEAKPESKSLPA